MSRTVRPTEAAGVSRGSLTVAVPTYNRAAAVYRALEDVAPIAGAGRVSALVIDDGSADGTWEVLQSFAESGARLLRNEKNRGYAPTFCRILREADTEWVLVSADDDILLPEALSELQEWLSTSTPDFVSTQWRFVDGRIHRGRSSVGTIRPSQLRAASNHAPGLVYRVSSARTALPLLEAQLRRGSVAARVYPQVLVAAHLLAGGFRAIWWPGTVIREGYGLASGITDHAGRAYYDPESRVAQALAFDSFFREMAIAAPHARYRRVSRHMRILNARMLDPAVLESAIADYPRSIEGSFDAHVVRVSWRRRRAVDAAKGIPGLARAVEFARSLGRPGADGA